MALKNSKWAMSWKWSITFSVWCTWSDAPEPSGHNPNWDFIVFSFILLYGTLCKTWCFIRSFLCNIVNNRFNCHGCKMNVFDDICIRGYFILSETFWCTSKKTKTPTISDQLLWAMSSLLFVRIRRYSGRRSCLTLLRLAKEKCINLKQLRWFMRETLKYASSLA